MICRWGKWVKPVTHGFCSRSRPPEAVVILGCQADKLALVERVGLVKRIDRKMNTFVTHLESALDGTRFPAGQVHTIHQGRPLWVRYDLERVRQSTAREDFTNRGPSLWRYRELLPLPFDAEPVTLGEGMTPLLPCPRLGAALGLSRLFIKDESQLPTGSFKSRGMTAAVSMAKHFGLRRLAIPTAGNAGGALAAYGARAGMEVHVFMPEDTPAINRIEAQLAGAHVTRVK